MSDRKSLDPSGGGRLKGRRILVIEDDADIRWMVTRVLEAAGAVARITSTAAEALTALATNDVDAILLDWHLEGETAESFIKALGHHHPQLLARTIVVTGQLVASASEHEAAQLGLPVLAKPFRPEDLRTAIEKLLEVE